MVKQHPYGLIIGCQMEEDSVTSCRIEPSPPHDFHRIQKHLTSLKGIDGSFQ